MDKNKEKEIKKACEKVVLEGEVTTLLAQKEKALIQAQQQAHIWDTRVKQLMGSVDTLKGLLNNSRKPKTLILEEVKKKK